MFLFFDALAGSWMRRCRDSRTGSILRPRGSVAVKGHGRKGLIPPDAIREHRWWMNRTPRRYDAEQVRRFSDTTIAYYDRFAQAFWNGTRGHDVSQNYAAFLDAIEGDPPYSILDLGCGPGRDLSHPCRRSNADRRRRVMAGKVGQTMSMHTDELGDSPPVAASSLRMIAASLA